MSDTANGPDLPRTGEEWETRNRDQWAPPAPGPTDVAPAGDARRAGQREDGLPSSFFHVRWLGEVD
jgi:hypothetical protein